MKKDVSCLFEEAMSTGRNHAVSRRVALCSLAQSGADEIYYETGDEDSPAVSGHQASGEHQGKLAERLRGQAGSRKPQGHPS
ncbi:hypothetical protein PHYPO_G00236940 [Pangasianodon hypophthalmus]|uniref:Uncharacterized protein n=1 Tax=Pangasianodon hypophthalmus TaxID=310915 RepID=A0A5N5NKI4_PANHP|nr:hypothetical protein PHYPO_G00236940 [Pangasianodon hypophthalmus]